MARVFISHSSRDTELAERIRCWLAAQGFDTPFLDFDKHAGIPPGADWERTLYREIERAEAVVIIQTSNWLSSKWCFAEFTQARALGKPIFPIIETPDGEALISPDIQSLDLRSDRDGGLQRLRAELTRLALDAQGGFAWDASRPPYPGLLAFQEDDAALYFGRDDDIRRLIERLNARRAQGGARLLALLGASGSGKSSLLRAGVLPRLRRAGRQWIVVPPFRPQARPIDELARALAVAVGPSVDWRALQAGLMGPAAPGGTAAAPLSPGSSSALETLLDELAGDLRVRAASPEAHILLPIDQAEELFSTAEPAQAARFLDLLSLMLSGRWPFMAVMAMRSDHLGELQSAEHLDARFEEFSLGPLPLARIPLIIQGPARVAGLKVDEAFVQQAVRDAETEDALPLLAFALRELYDRAGADHHLSLDDYRSLGDAAGGLTPLENAVRRAADGVLAEARPEPADLAALRDAFVPAMVRVNEQGDYVRRPARWDELPTRAQPLLERLARARLLVVRQDGAARLVEVAHEALLRKWPLLRGWLDEAREFLVGSQQLEQDRADWQRATESDKRAALLQGLKLTRARTWLADRPQQLSAPARAYVQASIAQADAEEVRRQGQRRRNQRLSVGASVVLALVAAAALWQWQEATQAADRLATTIETRANETLRFAWEDLAARRAEVLRLQALERRLGQPPGTLASSVVCATPDCLVTRKQPDGFDCNTFLDQGLRSLYCSVRSIVGLAKLQSISGLPVFRPGGPHEKEIDLSSKDRFGHYNPAFLDWLDRHLIPEGRSDPRLNQVTQRVYDAYLGPTVRALYHAHRLLHAPADRQAIDAADHERVGRAYRAKLQRRETNESRFEPGSKRLSLAEMTTRYEQAVRNGNRAEIEDDSRWLADYLATAFNDDWYLAHTAGGFWVRRKLDGTDQQIFGLINRLLQAFEPKVLASTR